MLSVELDIFSGRPNPTWILSKGEERELIDRLVADPSLMLPPSAETGGLGYRGFIVTSLSEDNGLRYKSGLPTSFRLGGIYDKDKTASLWLLDTSEKPDTEVDDYLKGIVSGSILNPQEMDTQQTPSPEGTKQSCLSQWLTSDTNFTFWNSAPYILYNNCYNFASNYRSNTIAQPGRKGGKMITKLDCYNIVNLVRIDGYKDYCLGGTAQNISICLVIWPNIDFHFYRLCQNRHWCHKPGSTPARNTDNSGKLIYSVETCNRGPYTNVCGYFYANRYNVVR